MSRSDDGALLRAVADNHRDWMARWAAAEGADAVTVGAATLYLADEAGVFPEVAPDPDALLEAIRAYDCRSVGYWSLVADDELGARLVARGFGWGWPPHWMAIELDDPAAFAPSPELSFAVDDAAPPYARTLPYAPSPQIADPPSTLRLGVRLREKVIGQIAVNPRDGVAGIYSMGVAPRARGRGIATALTREACRRAMIEHGCRYAVLNATDDGERVYRRVGFRSLGWGQTWWYFRGPAPTPRQVALAEAAGLGNVAALQALAPTDAELDGSLPGTESLLMLAVVTGRAGVVEYLLTRRPSFAARRFGPHATTLLHLAVEHDSAPLVEVALEHGVDPGVRDASFGGTALGWAEHFGRRELAVRLAEVTPAG